MGGRSRAPHGVDVVFEVSPLYLGKLVLFNFKQNKTIPRIAWNQDDEA